MNSATVVSADTALTNCETEPIRFPGAVQSHGALLVLRPESWSIEAASESCGSVFGVAPGLLLDRPLVGLVGTSTEAALRAAVAHRQTSLVELVQNGLRYKARPVASASGHVLLEIEAADDDPGASTRLLYQCRRELAALRLLRDHADILQQASAVVAAATGFERVMLYRFDEDWNGEVVGETCADGVEPLFGLHFPATDIPKQARELFKASGVRMIPDVLYTPSGLVCRGDPRAFDLAATSLRSVSPIHIEYLMNMRVRATLVGSLVVDGRLWGLVSCQQTNAPKYLGPEARDAIGWLCEDIGALIEASLVRRKREREFDLSCRRRGLMDALRLDDFRSLLEKREGADVLDVVGADGFALMVEGSVLAVGVTPATGRILEIQGRRRELETTPTLFATSALSRDLGLEDAGDGVAGALCVSVLNKPAITMMWFRRERQFEIRWGGDPAHAHIADDAGRLSPRKSFAQFLQNIRGQSTSWTQEELESAAELGSLIEIEALREREAFAQTILDSIPEHLAVLDARGVIVKVNRAWCRFAEANGASPAAASGVGLSYLDICMAGAGSPDGAEAWSARAGIEAVIGKSSDFFTLDYPCDSPTERRWFRMSVFPMIAPCDGVVVFHENVTQRKLAELALQSSQARVRSIFEAMTEGLVLHGRDGRILDANPAAEAILGRNRDEILGHASSDDSWQAFRGDGSPFPGREHPAMLALATGKSQLDVVMQVQPMNGARRWVQVNAVPTVVDGIVEGVVASFVDVTQLRAAIDRVTELNRTLEERVAQRTEQLRRLGGDLAAVEERERRQIARDLHDDIAQTLAAASIRLAGLQSMDDPEVRSIAGTVDGLIRAADQATRSLAAHLAPPALVEIGLVAALGVLCRELAEVYGLAVAVEDDGAPKPLSQEARAILYRAVRELLINVVKHARAGRAGVTCRRAGNDIVLKVADSGVGFDTGAVAARSAPGLGLPGIRERIMYIGGELELRTSPGAGTEAAITAPLMQASAPALQANA